MQGNISWSELKAELQRFGLTVGGALILTDCTVKVSSDLWLE